LKSYGDKVEGFKERVGNDFARGHNEATGGIIKRVSLESCCLLAITAQLTMPSQEEFEKLLLAIGIDENKTKTPTKMATKTGKGRVIDPTQKNGIKDFFRVAPSVSTPKSGS
jgi:hypothetical protein